MGALGLVRVNSNYDIAQRENAAVVAAVAFNDSQPVTALSGHIEKFWQSAWQAKLPIERQMLANLRARNGVYEPDDLALIRQSGGSEIFMMLTSMKCRAAESWLREILLPDTERPWGLDPTPMPDLPPPVSEAIIVSVTQTALARGWDVDDQRVDHLLTKMKWMATKRMKDLARKIADRHELRIEDQFAEGGWEQALSDCIYDLVTYPACIMKGPFLRKMKARQWIPAPNGQWIAKVTDVLRVCYERRSPFDIFPAAKSRGIQHGGFIDRHYLTRGDVSALIGQAGYADDALMQVLDLYGDKGYRARMQHDSERARLEQRQDEEIEREGDLETLQYWGSVSGRMLLDWGFTYGMDLERIGLREHPEPHKEYQIEAWKIGRFTIKAQINPDPLGERPYDKASFEENPGAFWGKAIPEIMADCQRMCNAAARSISNNAAIGSGPQVEINVDRIARGDPLTKPYPWKVWQTTTDMTGNNQPAVRFFQPSMEVQQLLVIYQHFDSQSDNVTGFPKYSYGDSRVGGAGRTASGLSQLMGNVGKGVRRVVAAMDRGVVRPKVERTYNFNMEWDPDVTIKFDLVAVARGASAVLMKQETAIRQRELLMATMNPLDAQIIGMKGRAEMLRPALKYADFDPTKILPDDLELALMVSDMPPPYQILGKTGPNAAAPGNAPGAGPTGGTPEGAENVNAAGNPLNGVDQREQSVGYRDGGIVRRPGGGRHSENGDSPARRSGDDLDYGV
jgi:hypothetical protein